MKNAYLLIAAIGLLLSSSCKYSTEYQAVNADNKFVISLPPWMKKEDGLKPGASLQYANRFRNFYVIGTADKKEDIKREAYQMVADNINVLRQSMKSPQVTDSTTVTFGGLTGSRVEIYGKMTNENIYFTEVLLEGKSRYYHLSIWTRSEERKLRFKEDINKILESFKEL